MQAIFEPIDIFSRRVLKLFELASNIQQFRSLAGCQLEGLAALINEFDGLVAAFQARGHDLLSAHSDTDFDREYVEFNVKIDALEVDLQQLIAGSSALRVDEFTFDHRLG